MIELDAIIESLRKLGASDLGARIAKRAATGLQDSLRQTLGAGQTPEGKAWPDRAIGGRAYSNAMARVECKASGDVVRATLSGPEVYGHFGAHGMPVRQMIPDAGAGIPASVEKVITEAARAEFEALTR